jgi:hypothetical protein
MSLNDDLLNEDPDSQAVEADDDAYYSPYQSTSVVVTEPEIITIGRGLRKDALKKERESMLEVPDEPS